MSCFSCNRTAFPPISPCAIYKTYGDESLAVVQQTPYRLVKDIYGIGFKTADKIAQALGMAHDDPQRIEAGIAYTLNRMAEDGHVYMPQEALEPEAAEILGVDRGADHGRARSAGRQRLHQARAPRL